MKRPRQRSRSFRTNQRGVVYVETLIGFLPIFLFFFGTLQLIDLSMAHLVVEHAASAAARAAVVVLPDDGLYYGDYANEHVNQFNGGRQEDVELAADIVLSANPRLKKSQTNVSICKDEQLRDNQSKCEKNPSFSGREPLSVLVSAPYRCFVAMFCPGGYVLKAGAQLTYQGAPYVYSPESNWAIGTINKTKTRLQDPPPAAEPAPDDGKPKSPSKKPNPPATSPTPPSKQHSPGIARNSAPGIVASEPDTDASGHVLPGGRRLLPVTNPTCFIAGTLVETPLGPRAIETIQVGDEVLAYDLERAALTVSRVAHTYERQTTSLVELEIFDPARHSTQRLTGTLEHPFYLPALGRFVHMAELSAGAILENDVAGPALVLSSSLRSESVHVFNLEIERRHNYFVAGPGASAAGVLVHNADYTDAEAFNDLEHYRAHPSTRVNPLGNRAAAQSSDGSVALVVVDQQQRAFGTNSTSTGVGTKGHQPKLERGREIVQTINELEGGNLSAGERRFAWHAEAQALYSAYKSGILQEGDEARLYVDRSTCHYACRPNFHRLVAALGLKRVTIVMKTGETIVCDQKQCA